MAQEIENTNLEEGEGHTAKRKVSRKKKGQEGGLDPNAWMVTFSDLIILMMTFFVLLFAFNDPNLQESQKIDSDTTAIGLFALSPPMLTMQEHQAQTMIRKNLEIFLAKQAIQKIQVEQSDQGLLIKLPADIFFEPQKATLTAKAIQTLKPLVNHLKKTTKRYIRIEGHTDSAKFEGVPDVWLLSLQRSHAVLELFLQHKMNPKQLSLVGKGDSEPEAKTTHARNRRVEIILLSPMRTRL